MKSKEAEELNNRLKKEIAALRKQNTNLSKKLEKTQLKTKGLKEELKKNDGQTIKLSKEQEQLLSNLLNDTDIQNLLSD